MNAPRELFELTGSNAIVTGAAMGIGRGIAEVLIEQGANVLIADRDADAAETTARELGDARGKAAWMAADVTESGAGEAMVQECLSRFGSVDVLVNNAGIFPMVPALEMTPETFDRVIDVNLKGLVFCAQAAARQMVRQGSGGRIINIGSIDSIHPSMVGLAAYDSSKGAVLMFTKSLALELAAEGVLVNMIAPGGIETPGASKPLEDSGMTTAQMDEVRQNFARQIPLGRFGQPREIGSVTAFLASRASAYMTGSVLVVDGGRLLM